MRRGLRRLRGSHPVPARRLSVRPHKPWYWRLLWMLLLIAAGYALAQWRAQPASAQADIAPHQQALLRQVVMVERQLQIEREANKSAAQQMTELQSEVIRLKEDVAFYQGVLEESSGAATVKFQNIRLTLGQQPDSYQFRVVLVQSGRHDRLVEGTLRLSVQSGAPGRRLTQPLALAGQGGSLPVRFKYYQKLEGSFVLPRAAVDGVVLVELSGLAGQPSGLARMVPLPH